jgi:hypothetical protein
VEQLLPASISIWWEIPESVETLLGLVQKKLKLLEDLSGTHVAECPLPSQATAAMSAMSTAARQRREGGASDEHGLLL